MQHTDQRKSDTLRLGKAINAKTYPIIQTIPLTILTLLSYISLSFSSHNFALNAIIHFPTNVDMIVVYMSEAMANTHTFQFMKQRYNPNRQPHKDSANAR